MVVPVATVARLTPPVPTPTAPAVTTDLTVLRVGVVAKVLQYTGRVRARDTQPEPIDPAKGHAIYTQMPVPAYGIPFRRVQLSARLLSRVIKGSGDASLHQAYSDLRRLSPRKGVHNTRVPSIILLDELRQVFQSILHRLGFLHHLVSTDSVFNRDSGDG